VAPDALGAVMVRRLKSDLLRLGVASFPERKIEPVVIDGLPLDAPELLLSARLQDLPRMGARKACRARAGAYAIPVFRSATAAVLVYPAFARTLRRHLATLKRHRDGTQSSVAARCRRRTPGARKPPKQKPGETDDTEALLGFVKRMRMRSQRLPPRPCAHAIPKP